MIENFLGIFLGKFRKYCTETSKNIWRKLKKFRKNIFKNYGRTSKFKQNFTEI